MNVMDLIAKAIYEERHRCAEVARSYRSATPAGKCAAMAIASRILGSAIEREGKQKAGETPLPPAGGGLAITEGGGLAVTEGGGLAAGGGVTAISDNGGAA